ncbi:MAG: hypothetical protein IT179_04905 [Acidobacteria bacterium]|nr:hypothetical protein [Acidobacteriota bacterium]
MPHLTEDQLVLHHYGEDTDEEQREAVAHLAQCAECREGLDRLRHVLGMVTADSDPQAPDGFERVMWARLQPHIEGSRSREGGWASWLGLRGPALAGGLAALVIAAFVAGRWSGAPGVGPLPEPVATVPAGTAGDARPEGVLLVAMGEHLDRSQMVIVELLNADDTDPASLSAERERAADLVAANRLIRQSAEQAGEAALADVLDDLERVLIEIANGSGDASSEELQLLKARIEQRGILFRMRVVGAEVRERERAPRPLRAPES